MAKRVTVDQNVVWTLDAKAFRAEIRRLSDIANKRMKRLEEREWGDSPALKALRDEGIAKFSVKGKTHQEVQNMAGRLIKFLNAETSTVSGAIENVKDIASITGITYDSVKELKDKMSKFFELQSKITQYLKAQGETAAALDYRQIWNGINQYVQQEEIDLAEASVSVESMIEDVDRILKVARRKLFQPMDGDSDFIELG